MATGVVFNHFPQIAVGLKPALQQAVTHTAQAIEANAQTGAPVDTGFLQSSIYSVTPDGGSTYGTSTGSPPGDAYLLPEVAPDDDMSAIVAVAANYGEYPELGTRFMGAQPYFYPAVDAGQAILDAELAAVADGVFGSVL